jgi:hypothetical protein
VNSRRCVISRLACATEQRERRTLDNSHPRTRIALSKVSRHGCTACDVGVVLLFMYTITHTSALLVSTFMVHGDTTAHWSDLCTQTMQTIYV